MINIMIKPLQIMSQYVKLCGCNLLKPPTKMSALDFDSVTFSKVSSELDDIFESKTLTTLFTPEFKPNRREGHLITTVIDRATDKPVEVNVRLVDSERYILEIKNHNGINSPLGFIDMTFNRKNYDGIFIEKMNTESGNPKYAGLGTRMLQLAIEMSMQIGKGGRVFFDAGHAAASFHYKNGFRPTQDFRPIIQEKLEYLCQVHNPLAAKLNLNDITKVSDGKISVDMAALRYETKIRTAILNRVRSEIAGGVPMELRGVQLEKWKARIATQPILLD